MDNSLSQYNYPEEYTPLDYKAPVRMFYIKSSDQTSLSLLEKYRTFDRSIDMVVSLLSTNDITYFQNKERKYIQLTVEFFEEWSKKKSVFNGIQQLYVISMWKNVVEKLLTLNCVYLSFKLTDDISIFYQVELLGHKVYVELFFDSEAPKCVEAIVNIYKDGKAIVGFGGTIEDIFDKMVTFFSKIKDHYPEPTKTNEVSNLFTSLEGPYDDFGGSTISRAFFNSPNTFKK